MAGATAAVADRLDQSKLKFVEIDGIRTRYYEDGAGEPLVLLHGGQFGSGYSLDAWSLVLPTLARHFHVYALDKLGQGQTGNPKGDAYTFESLLDHTYGWLQMAGIRGAHLVGHSRGGLLITRLAQTHPEVAKSLVIVDSNTLAPDDPTFPGGEFYAEIARRTPPGPATRETVRMEPEAQSFSAAHITDDFADRLRANALLPVRQESDERMKVVANEKWFPTMARAKAEALRQIAANGLPVPTLIIWGLNDVSAPFRNFGLPLLDLIAAKTPRTITVLINQTGHYVMREQPDAFVRALRGFCLD
jgi:2-hydroxy-6-oxonona-2,4-dienedioate hydrolase